ncbi:glycosyltransferase family 4 protein [Labrys sp. LIt4]|uniref:glycosyltransferase family 4 protein n=1 Tax=Labrys sp. LIt4 TaxID=2821355 RepID=UPI001ADF8A6A|nr:glycosyltransferase family 4 protein [Labrys sp. LIt4]MBP0581174.1 glycosyltransferase family 4 protein [Labrys sp. LIt4]
MRLAILTSHPIQYQAPIFRELARRMDLEVFFAHRPTPRQQADAGFGVAFDWDIDLLAGYPNRFLANKASNPGVDNFFGCDTPAIAQALREGSFDALLVCGWALKSYLQAIAAARRLAMPVLVRGDSHLLTPRRRLKAWTKRAVYPRLLRFFDAALYVGQNSLAYYRHYGYPPERLHFSPHCVDTDWFAARATTQARQALRSSLSIGEASRAIAFVGKLVERKRPLDLIEAAALCGAGGREIEVVIAGDGPLREAVQARATQLGVRLHFLGFRNQSEMPAVYAACDGLALASSGQETWGLVANEAQACGRPVIVSDQCGCAPDLAADRDTGRVFETGNVGALAAALADLPTGTATRSALAALACRYGVGAAADGIEAGLASCSKRTADHRRTSEVLT